MNYREAVEYICGINPLFCDPGLARVEALCEQLGHPEKGLKFIHVAGTNGKGSFCSMMSSVLRAAGYKTGLFTSPNIKDFNERIQINGKNIPNERLVEITERIRPIADAMKDKPTEFELITVIAFEYFAREKCDVVVLEVGLGGRLDATNVIRKPLLSVITGIALDHTAILGDTVEKIASEKAGIIKDGSPVLFGGDSDAAFAVISDIAQKRGSDVFRTDRSALRNIRADLSGSSFDYRDRKAVEIRLLGLYQPQNASTVLDAIDILRRRGMNIPESAVREGLLCAVWNARFERVCDEPLIIFDGAHNPQGIAQAVASIKHYFGGEKVYLLTGVLRDKNYTDIAHMLSEVACRAFTLTPASPRALSSEEYARVLNESGIDASPYESIEAAFRAAKTAAREDKVPLICLGSLYVYRSLCPLF